MSAESFEAERSNGAHTRDVLPEKEQGGTPPHRSDEESSTEHAQNETSTPQRVKGRCDVCQKGDGFQGHHLIKCKECGVCVHELCIGEKHKPGRNQLEWKCAACTAVGKNVVVSKPGKKRRTICQESRPRECALCDVHDGTHHMHPLYDTDGPTGTHLVLPQKEKQGLPARLAWVHTLCAMFIAKNVGGVVYACDKDGDYEGDTDESDVEEEEFSDSNSVSSVGSGDIGRDKQRKDDPNASSNSKTAPSNEKTAAENGSKPGEGQVQKALEAEDSNEDDLNLMETHHFVIAGKENGEDTPWTRTIREHRGLHCTFCGKKDTGHSTRIPVQCSAGSDREYVEYKERHEAHRYCVQAMHVGCARWKQNDRGEAPKHNRVFYYPGLEIGSSGSYDDPVADCYCDEDAEVIFRNNPKRTQEREQQNEVSRAKRLQKRHARQEKRSATMPTAPKSPPEKRRRGSDTDRGLDELALKRIVRGKDNRNWLPEIRDDVLAKIRSAEKLNQDTLSATAKCKKYWMEQLEIPKAEFKKLWSDVKQAVMETIDNEGSATEGESPSNLSKPKRRSSNEPMGKKENNPWNRLWMDDFCEGGEFLLNKWDATDEEEMSM